MVKNGPKSRILKQKTKFGILGGLDNYVSLRIQRDYIYVMYAEKNQSEE